MKSLQLIPSAWKARYHAFFCQHHVHEFMLPIRMADGLLTLRCRHCLRATLMTDRQLWWHDFWPRALGFLMIPGGPALAAFLLFRFDHSLPGVIALDTMAVPCMRFIGKRLLEKVAANDNEVANVYLQARST